MFSGFKKYGNLPFQMVTELHLTAFRILPHLGFAGRRMSVGDVSMWGKRLYDLGYIPVASYGNNRWTQARELTWVRSVLLLCLAWGTPCASALVTTTGTIEIRGRKIKPGSSKVGALKSATAGVGRARNGMKWRLVIAGIGVTGRCALKFLGRFEVSYIPPP